MIGKRLIGLVAGLLAVVTVQAGPRYNLVPLPKTLVEAPGDFVLNKATALVVEDALFSEIADDFRAQVALTTGFGLAGKGGQIFLRKVDGLGKEAYRLQVTPERICIEATEVNGAFYGLQTILQLLPAEIYGKARAKGVKWTVPCCTIEDEPAFWYRGTLFDSGRFFFPKEEIMKFIDLMAMHKQNMFHWHLTEDQGWRIELKRYPELTEIGAFRNGTMIAKDWESNDGVRYGGYYTQEQIRDIVAYADELGITVISKTFSPRFSMSSAIVFLISSKVSIRKNLGYKLTKFFQNN